jgi:hemerythrin superfamily protein
LFLFTGLNQNQVIQPAFVWIDYDCQTKIINLGFRWKAPGITIDLATIDIDTSADLKIYYQWIIQHHEIQNLRTSISGNARYMELLNEAISKFLRTMFRYFNRKIIF